MIVPVSRGQESKYYKREERIAGKNLTQADTLVLEGHDLKEIAQALIADLKIQFATSLLHADFHPGNIRVTPDKGIAILDRNFFLELDAHDQRLMATLLSGNMSEFPQALNAYLTVLPENARAGNQITVAIASTLTEAFMSGASPDKVLVDLMKRLKKAKVRIPLKITLIIKNLLALDKFARKAGYQGGLVEAFGES